MDGICLHEKPIFLVVMMERIYFDGIVAINLIEPREFSYVVLRAESIVFGGDTGVESI